jgi:DNA-binding SARP family transcriptional activator
MAVEITDPRAGPTLVEPVLLRLNLLDRLELLANGNAMPMPDASQRLLAFLALRRRPQHRTTAAGTLWTENTDERAAANLRTALWRLRKVCAPLIVSDGPYLHLSPGVSVDLSEVVDATHRLVADPQAAEEPGTTVHLLDRELLPNWYEDWVLLERERLRQVRLHGLEALCIRLVTLGRHAQAIEAGLAAVAAEPLRESSQRALIAAHLAEGNVCEAIRQYDTYREMLWDQLRIDPGPQLRAVVAPCR